MNKFKTKTVRQLLLLVCTTFYLSVLGLSGQITLTGKVTSATDNSSLPGVNVLIKGTTNGAITNIDGEYSINVSSEDAILVFSMIGMLSEEVKVGLQRQIDVAMVEDLVGLDEVVVVGYGTMRKSDISGSIVSVGEEEMTEVKTANVMESLQGKMAGVDITLEGGKTGSTVDILVRGNKTLIASPEPLFIVDGIPYGNNLNLNQNDIASIEVLKDASSTAIYGSRGANGVVLVTTKRGKAGMSKVYFNTYMGYTQPYQKIPVFDAEGYIGAKYDANRDIYNWDAEISEETAFPSPTERQGIADGTDTDWQEICTKNGFRQDYHLGFMGGKENIVYNTSLSYFKEDGVTLADKFQRYTYNLNIDGKVNNFIKVGGSLVLNYKQHDGRGVRFTDAILLSPIVPCFDSTGNYIYQPDLVNSRKNPLVYTDDSEQETGTNILSTVYGQINFTNDFYFKSSFGANLDFERFGYMYPQTVPEDDITEAGVNLTNIYNYTWTNLFNYSKQISTSSINLTFGHEVQSNKREYYTMSGESQPFVANDWWNMGSVNQETNFATSRLEIKRLVSVFGRINYNYNDLVLLNATGRYDGASQLTEGNKWDFFPSLSAALRLKNLEFMKTVDPISDLKFRIGYGATGNAAVNAYDTKGLVNNSPLRYQFGDPGAEVNVDGYRPEYLASESLFWEITKQYNIGLDFGLFKSRLAGSIDMYKSNTEDIILPEHLPLSTGFFDITTNIGELETKGIELMLQTVVINSGDFKWDVNVTFTHNRDKLLALSSGIERDLSNEWFVGESINSIYDYEKLGIWQMADTAEADVYFQQPGDIRVRDVLNSDDSVRISEEDKVILGTTNPNWTGSLVSTLKFKGFDFTFNIYARMGQTIDADAYAFDPRMYDNMLAVDYWTPNNPTNEYPRFRVGEGAELDYESTLRYRDGSYVKLKNITLGYNLPEDLIKTVRISRLRVYVTFNNPLILYSKLEDGIDPERNGSYSWPLARTALLGLNVEF